MPDDAFETEPDAPVGHVHGEGVQVAVADPADPATRAQVVLLELHDLALSKEGRAENIHGLRVSTSKYKCT